jgi:protein O-mannosyl-transferase
MVTRAKTLARTRAQSRKKLNKRVVQKSAPFVGGKGLKAILCLLLAGATIALYCPVIGHSFIVFDDRDYITANPYVQSGLSWKTVKWAFTSTTAANWHPLTWLSHALDYQLFGLNPAGHHFDSVLIHALNAVVLFLLFVAMTNRIAPSLLVAALFALHPINVESVAWAAERKNVLSTLFFFLAIAAYVWYARKPDWRRYLLMAGLFAAGLMAKPMVITLPFVLLLLDYWPLGRLSLKRMTDAQTHSQFTLSKLLIEKIPLFLLSAMSAWITLEAQRGAVRSLEEFPFTVRLENALVSYGLYLWKTFWPVRLAFYPHSVVTLPFWHWGLALLVLITITAFVISFSSKEYLLVGWLWFLGTLIPVIGLVQVGEASMADRYAYIPLIGIFVMMAWSVADWIQEKQFPMVWPVIFIVCALTALGFAASRQMSYWESEYDLWTHALAVREDPFAHNAVGAALMNPDAAMTAHDLENFDTVQKRTEEARRHFQRAMEMRLPLAQQDHERYLPYLAGSLSNLGSVDQQQNRTEEARQNFESALQIYRQLAQQNPDAYLYYLATTLNNLGFLDRIQNHTDEARGHYEESLNAYRQLAKRNPDAYLVDMATLLNNLGNLNARENKMDEARQYYDEALESYPRLAQQNPATYLPDMATTLTNLANLDLLQSRPDDARQHFERALDLRRQLAQQNPDVYLPAVVMTLNSLGRVDRLENRIEESRAHYMEELNVLRKLAQSDSKYLGDIARVEADMKDLN